MKIKIIKDVDVLKTRHNIKKGDVFEITEADVGKSVDVKKGTIYLVRSKAKFPIAIYQDECEIIEK